MFAVVRLQLLVMAVSAAVCWAAFGAHSAVSLLFGCATYILPTAVSVLILKISAFNPQKAGWVFIMSEGLKIALAAVLLAVCMLVYPQLQFLPYLAGLVVVSHLVFLFFLRVHRYGK